MALFQVAETTGNYSFRMSFKEKASTVGWAAAVIALSYASGAIAYAVYVSTKMTNWVQVYREKN
jgi:hypothetical protein